MDAIENHLPHEYEQKLVVKDDDDKAIILQMVSFVFWKSHSLQIDLEGNSMLIENIKDGMQK